MKAKQHVTKREDKQETKRHPEMKIRNNPKSMDTAEAVQEIHSITGIPHETRKMANKQSNSLFKGTRKRATKLRISRRKEILNIGAEINNIKITKEK